MAGQDKASNPPVGERERIAELLDALEMGGVAGDQLQAVHQGYRRDDRIGHADCRARSRSQAGRAG
jgi:hypothetical protein